MPAAADHTDGQATFISSCTWMAVRRNARLRREYLYRKGLEGKERQHYERKRRIREALQEGKAIPTELTAEADATRDELALDDDAHAEQKTHMDDEYARAGEIEPKVLITTARDPSSRLKQFGASKPPAPWGMCTALPG
eukprot:SAG25_NODE_67_length_17436_cov_89.239257_10_plen_139_part_00